MEIIKQLALMAYLLLVSGILGGAIIALYVVHKDLKQMKNVCMRYFSWIVFIIFILALLLGFALCWVEIVNNVYCLWS